MDVLLNRSAIRRGILGDDAQAHRKRACEAADRIVEDIQLRELPVGYCIGTMEDLAQTYGASRRIIHEASRILELRGATKVQRGAHGGVFVTVPSMMLAVDAIVDYCLALGVSDDQVEEATRACELLRQAGMREHGLLGPHISQTVAESAPRRPSLGHELICSFITAAVERVMERRQPTDFLQASSRGAQIAHELKAGITQSPGRSVRLGTEDELCERFAVSRPVLRHAIRILEDRGLIESQRGRGRGVIIKAPDPRPAMQVASAFFDSVSLTRANLRQAKNDLGVLVNMFATPKFDRSRYASDVDAVLDERINHTIGMGPGVLAPHKLMWIVLNNPVLSLIHRSVMSYNTTLLPDKGAACEEDVRVVSETLSEWMRAFAAGDQAASVAAANRRTSVLDQIFA